MTEFVWEEQPRLWPSSGPSKGSQICLCLHGLGGGVYEFQFLAEFLTRRGLPVQTVLYPGHGPPPQPMPPSSWQHWADHVLDQLQTLYHHYDQIIVVGFSTGAALALYLALTQPVQALVLISPLIRLHRFPPLVFSPELFLNTLGWLIPHLPRPGLAIRDPEMKALSRSTSFSRTFRLQVVRSALDLVAHVKPHLSQIQIPTLILQPQSDSVVDVQGAIWIHQHLGSQVKPLIWFEHSEHNLLLDLERDTCFSHIWNFLQEHVPC